MKKSQFKNLLKHLNELGSIYIIYKNRYIINTIDQPTNIIVCDDMSNIIPIKEDKIYLISNLDDIKAVSDNLLVSDDIYENDKTIYVNLSKLETAVKVCTEVPFSSYDSFILDKIKYLENILSQNEYIEYTEEEILELMDGVLVTKNLNDKGMYIRMYKKMIPRLKKSDKLRICVFPTDNDMIYKVVFIHNTEYGDAFIEYFIVSTV